MQYRSRPARAQRGISLIITLIMMVIIGLTAGAAMRSAVSSEKVINNMRSEALAQQYAEVALRYCEQQMELASAMRAETRLRDASLVTTLVGGTPAWNGTATWVGGASLKTTVPDVQFRNTESSVSPIAPECFVEKQALADGTIAVVVTARGFSPDYAADSDGQTTAGSVVWLQSTTGIN